METILITVHVLVAVMIVVLVLLQQGKGADAGFGAGGAGTVFGSSGTGNFLSRTTAILATTFFATSLALAYVAKTKAKGLYTLDAPAVETVKTDEKPTAVAENATIEKPNTENNKETTPAE